MERKVEVRTKEIEKVEKIGKPVAVPDSEELDEKRGFAKRFPTVKARVLSILRNDNYARKNYLWLLLRYWSNMGHIKIVIPKDKFEYVNSPETITRAFRKVMQEAKEGDPKLKFLLKDKETLEFRKQEQRDVRNYFSNDKIERKAPFIK